MKRAFLFFAVAILYCSPSLAQEPEPDPNLLWTTENSYIRFLVHPNGNIIAGKGEIVELGSTEFEIDGNTGMVIREFDSPMLFFDISPDGRYISANDANNWKCVIDYETGEVIHQVTHLHTRPMFMPDSRTLVYFVNEPISGIKGNLKLQSYNIDTKKYKSSANFIQNTTTGTIAVSPDGRYIATSGRNFNNDDDGYTQLILWNAETLAPIKYLKEFESYQPVRSIKFSPDSRLVGFVVYLDDLYIYKTDDYSLYKHYGEHNTEYGIGGFCFINEDHIGNKYGPLTYILNLHNGSFEFKTGVHGGTAQSIIEKKQVNNTLITGSGSLIAWDLNKIMTNIIEPEIPNPFSVEYLNNTLSIRNFTFVTNQISCSITDINGRVLRNINLNTSSNDIRIPIKLLSGTYFLHIKDGGKEYVAKFLVVN
jgi:hypothetical protein